MTSTPTDPRAAAPSRWLIVAGVLTLAATAWTALQTDDTAPASPRPRAETAGRERASLSRTSATAETQPWPAAPSPENRLPWPAAAAIGVAAWSPPPPPTAPPAPPTPPPSKNAAAEPLQAPPFPYTLIGRLDDGEPRALLSSPLRSFGVKTAEVLDGAWRIDRVDAQGIGVTWLPGGVKKTIPFASS